MGRTQLIRFAATYLNGGPEVESVFGFCRLQMVVRVATYRAMLEFLKDGGFSYRTSRTTLDNLSKPNRQAYKNGS